MRAPEAAAAVWYAPVCSGSLAAAPGTLPASRWAEEQVYLAAQFVVAGTGLVYVRVPVLGPMVFHGSQENLL
jgi:hypothetical protein